MNSKNVFIILLIGLLILPTASMAASLEEIKALASSPKPGDVVLVWVPGGFWVEPADVNGILYHNCTWPGQLVTRSDGTKLWIEPNFWNVANATGENYMRFIKSKDQVAFYATLSNVETVWGGIAFGNPDVVFAGRTPPGVAGGTVLPPTGGYTWITLPMAAQDFLNQYDTLYVKINYEVFRRDDTLVRTGLLMWFENADDGSGIGEVYVAFHDDFGGWVGDKTVVKTITVPLIVNGELVNGEFEVQRALSGGGWAAMVFLLKNTDIMSGEVYVDLKPFVNEVFDQLVNFFGIPAEKVVWSSVAFSTYFGSEGTEAELGWVLYDARLVPPELAPKIVKETVTETVTETATHTEKTTVTETTTVMETETKTEVVTHTDTDTTTVTTTAAPDAATLAIIGIIALIIGFVIGIVAKGGRRAQ
ncbi:MAG: hypothetical protein J7J82_06115 [Staphylothermus sp.]|nr:hypothetical protein [Staphylothermus sp.]